MANPTFFSEGSTPNRNDTEWEILQKMLGALTDLSERGVAPSYTVAELDAMSAAQARAVGIAYATDALNPDGVYGSTGAMCVWAGTSWYYSTYPCPIANNIGQFLLNCARFGIPSTGVSNIAQLSPVTVTSGTGASVGGAVSTTYFGSSIQMLAASTGTTATGNGGSRSSSGNLNSTEAESRALMYAFPFVACDQSTGGDTFTVCGGFETCGANIATALSGLQSDSVGIYYDESNILGLGSTGSNFYALTRGNGTTFDWVNTGISRSTPHWQLTVLAPVSSTTAQMLVYTALANGGSLTKHVDRTVTLSSNFQTRFQKILKASGTNAKLSYFMNSRRELSWRTNSLTSTTFPQ